MRSERSQFGRFLREKGCVADRYRRNDSRNPHALNGRAAENVGSDYFPSGVLDLWRLICSQPSRRRLISFSNPRSVGR
jgi:hypothetical protein